MVDAERDRRIAAGFEWNGYNWQFDTTSKQNITGSGSLAAMAIMQGAAVGDYTWNGGTEPFQWVTADNQRVSLDAHDMFEMARSAASHVNMHFMAGRALKDFTTIPASYADDDWWP